MAKDPSTRIAYLVRMVSNTLTQQIEQAMRPVDLTQAQLGALTQLSLAGEPLSGAELARRNGVTAQSMANGLAELLERGLVTRRPHPTHKRKLDYEATEAGAELADRAQALTATVDVRALALLDDEQARQLRALLLSVGAALGLPDIPTWPSTLPDP